VLVVKLVVPVVDECRDGTDRLIPAPRDEIIAFHVLPGGVVFAVELVLLHRQQRGYPIRIVFINRPGEREKCLIVRFGFDQADADGLGHTKVLSLRRRAFARNVTPLRADGKVPRAANGMNGLAGGSVCTGRGAWL